MRYDFSTPSRSSNHSSIRPPPLILAHELVKSLDAPRDSDAADAWDSEILRRLSEIEAGTARLVDRDELRRRMRARLDAPGANTILPYESDNHRPS